MIMIVIIIIIIICHVTRDFLYVIFVHTIVWQSTQPLKKGNLKRKYSTLLVIKNPIIFLFSIMPFSSQNQLSGWFYERLYESFMNHDLYHNSNFSTIFIEITLGILKNLSNNNPEGALKLHPLLTMLLKY